MSINNAMQLISAAYADSTFPDKVDHLGWMKAGQPRHVWVLESYSNGAGVWREYGYGTILITVPGSIVYTKQAGSIL